MITVKTGLSQEALITIESAGNEVKFLMGEVLISGDQANDEVYIIKEGEVRQISNQLGTDKKITLGIHGRLFAAGLSSVQANQSIEVITAARDTVAIKITGTMLQKLSEKNKDIREYFESWLSPADLWHLASQKEKIYIPENTKEMRSWLNRLTQLSSAEWITHFSDENIDLEASKRWFVCGGNIDSDRFGERLTEDFINRISNEASAKVRVIGLPRSLWLGEPNDGSHMFLGRREQKMQLAESDGGRASDTHISNDSEKKKDELQFGGFRFFESIDGVIPEAVACFRTISHVLNLPLKVDLLTRVLEEQAARGDGSISLQVCGAIAESLGLQTQLLSLPVELIGRLKTPCFVHLLDGELCVGLAAKDQEVLLSRPTKGIGPFSVDELIPLCNEDRTISVLILHKTDRTPEKRFGLSWFVPAIKKNKQPLIEVLIASLFVQLFQLMNPLVIQQIIDQVIGKNGMSTLPVLAVLLLSFSVFENLLTAIRTNLFIDTTNRIDISLGEQVIDHLLRLPMNYFDKRPVGELSSRIGELEQIRSFLTGTALTVVLDAIFSFIYIVVMLFYSWTLTIVALLVAPILAIIVFSTSPIIRRQLRSKAELNAKTQNHLVEILTGIQTVKAQNFELKARWRWKERYSDYVAEGFKTAVTATARNGLTQFLNQVSTLSIICVGAYLVLTGELSLGQLIAFRIIAGYVTTPLLRLSSLYQGFQQTSISLERLSDIIDTPQESTETDKKNIPLSAIDGKVEYDNLSFRFAKSGPLQLSQVNLTIDAGQFVAVVGQSGSGKSTLTKLLPRLYEPTSGRILVDDTDISKVELYSLRRQIGIVPQESLLFEGSVQDNISLSNPEATSEEVITAARIACAHEFIMSLPSGYASPVGERGGSLSGGQRQRIAIARTVLQNPRLLIMDEATSALDYQTERLVSLNLMEHFRGRTVLFITHRLSSVIHADLIVMMHQGQIEEQGTHEELMALNGRYFALFKQQEPSG